MIQVKENTTYKLRNGWKVGPLFPDGQCWRDQTGGLYWLGDGRIRGGAPNDNMDIVAEHPASLLDTGLANLVSRVRKAETALNKLPPPKPKPKPKPKEIEPMADGTRLFESDTMIGVAEDFAPDIKAELVDEAKRIVNGPRRSAYGKPLENFERIARYWQAYFENTGRGGVKITAADVSPMMRFVKEARLNETPDHYDGHLDLIGYALTGAEVNGVKKPG